MPRIDLTLRLRHGAELRGRVSLLDGRPLAGVTVAATALGTRLGPLSPTHLHYARSGPDGAYRLTSLAPGQYDLWTRRNGSAWIKDAAVEIPAVTRYDFRLYEGATVAGRVTRKADGKPVAGARVVIYWENPHSPARRDLAWTTTDGSGLYALRSHHEFVITPGVRVEAKGFATTYRSGYALCGSSDDRLATLPDGERFGCDVALEPESRVEGRVTTSDGPVASADVILWLDKGHNYTWLRPLRTVTTADGAYAFEALGAGAGYIEVATLGISSPGWPERSAIGRRARRDALPAARLEFSTGKTVQRDVHLDSVGEMVPVEGVVRDKDGKPIPLAIVSAGGPATLTGVDGRFRTIGLKHPWLGVEVLAEAEGCGTKSTYPDARGDGGLCDVVITLQRAPVLTGTVTSAIAVDVARARVFVAHQAALLRGGKPGWGLVRPTEVGRDGTYELFLPALENIETVGGAFNNRISNRFAVCVLAEGHAPALSRPFELRE
ncbi:MAG: carboxypeptidase-like regulatory domain-containing protein, partial [Planctomycetota bacterium]